MRARIFLLLAIIATPAMAFRARPVSDFRFEDRPGIEHCVAAASDGSDYLVLFNARWQVYVQIVSQGVSYGPPVWIGEGEGVAAFWTGSRYVVVWKAYNRGVFLTAVSRRGSLLYAPTLIIPGNGVEANAAWNGRTILVTSGQVGAFATLGGGVFAGWFLLPFTGNIRALIGTDDGFAAATFNNTEIRVYRLDDSARPVLAGGTQVEVPAASTLYFSQGALASDGTNVAVIFTSFTGFFDASMKSVIVGARGEIVQGPRILSHPGGEVLSALWNGSEYVADVRLPSNERTLNQQQIALQRISRAGEPMDTLITVATQQLYGGYDRDIIASNGREYLITGGNSFIRLAIGSTSPTAPAELTNRLLDEQGGLSFARGPQGFLAVWKEWGRDSITVRASRLDREGRNLDGAGIVLDTLQADWSNRIYLSRTSVDSNGGTWLAVWAKDGYIYGRRISSDGVVLDPKPVAIFPGYYPVVRWGINSCWW